MSQITIYEKLSGPISIGTLLRAYRVANSLSSAELEKKLKMSKNTLNSIEAGKKKLTMKETVDLARKLGEPVDYYVQIWLKDQAREAGVKLETFLK